jgi:thymidylate synthase
MTHVYEAETVDQAWRAAASEFRGEGVVRAQIGRGGITQELLHAIFTVRDPRQRWVVSRHPAINPAFAIAEVVWILNGRNDASFVNHWNPRLPQYAGNVDCYHAAYGFRLRKEFGFDQLDRAYKALSNNPDTRQVVLQIWNPQIDFPDAVGQPVASDIPCNVCALPKIRENKLEWLQIMRSNDLQRGLPYNFVQFTCLQEIMAGWLGVEVGAYCHVSDSLHVYEKDAADLQAFTPVEEAPSTDSLALAREESEVVLSEMDRLMTTMTIPDMSREALLSLMSSVQLPPAYQNLLRVVAADSARRRGWIEVAGDLMIGCSNPALSQAWEGWIMRCGGEQEKPPVAI